MKNCLSLHGGTISSVYASEILIVEYEICCVLHRNVILINYYENIQSL